MNTSRPWQLALALSAALLLAACQDSNTTIPPPPPASPAPAAPAPAPATDEWAGQWNGPEGTFVRITGSGGQYEVTIQNLDGPRTFAGTAVGDKIEFQRDGKTQTLRASNGEQTGMKWLAEKKDCLVVRAGEGYCRD